MRTTHAIAVPQKKRSEYWLWAQWKWMNALISLACSRLAAFLFIRNGDLAYVLLIKILTTLSPLSLPLSVAHFLVFLFFHLMQYTRMPGKNQTCLDTFIVHYSCSCILHIYPTCSSYWWVSRQAVEMHYITHTYSFKPADYIWWPRMDFPDTPRLILIAVDLYARIFFFFASAHIFLVRFV